MVNWRNFTFEYYWHVLAAFGMNPGRMSSRNQTIAHVIGKGQPASNASACYQHSVYDWIYLRPSEVPSSPRVSRPCSSIVPASLPPGNYELHAR